MAKRKAKKRVVKRVAPRVIRRAPRPPRITPEMVVASRQRSYTASCRQAVLHNEIPLLVTGLITAIHTQLSEASFGVLSKDVTLLRWAATKIQENHVVGEPREHEMGDL